MDKVRRQIVSLIILLLALSLPGGIFLLPGDALAQGIDSVFVYPPDLSTFPVISTYMDVLDANQQVIPGLQADAVTLLENDQPVALKSFEEQSVGAQIIVAINPGPALAVRDGEGVSRYEKLNTTLTAWASSLPQGNTDHFSLVSSAGVLHTQGTRDSWLLNFTSFNPANRDATPSLQALSLALGVFEQSPAIPGEKRAVLFITPHIDNAALGALDDITTRAATLKVRVFVWLVDSDAYLTHSSAYALSDLAIKTGGQFITYTASPAETLPNPESYFAPLRSVYALSYLSLIRQAGDQKLVAQVQIGDVQVLSPDVVFPLDVQPPNPMLLSPPVQIIRQVPEGEFEIDRLAPASQKIQILIEYPDGIRRELVRTTLFVDGAPVAKNISEPFDQFSWDLSAYTQSGVHTLKVEVEDSLGLVQSSFAVPVTVTVIQPPTGLRAFLTRYNSFVIAGATVLAGVVLVIIILVGTRMRLPSFSSARRARKQRLDPVTQPVPAAVEPPTARRKQQARTAESESPSPFPWLRRSKQTSAPASLERVDADGWPTPSAPILLAAAETTFGTDPTQAVHVLDDPSISGLHARLRYDGKGNFMLVDHNSVAGTWVNFEQIPPEGRKLQHGDIIHFGQLSYRFILKKAPNLPEPRVIIEK